MARADWGKHPNSNSFNNNYNVWGGRSKLCSYKRAALLVCCINIFVALYVLHSLYTSLYLFPSRDLHTTFKYSPEQIRKMEESIQIRKASEPVKLLRLVNQLKNVSLKERTLSELPGQLKQMILDEIAIRLKELDDSSNATKLRDTVESWRISKLREANKVIHGETLYSSISSEAAGVLVKALDSDWPTISEEIGLWIPVEFIHTVHDDRPEGEEGFEEEFLAGRKLPPECNAEFHTDYGGDAIKWGLTHPKESAYECCMACLKQAKNAKSDEKQCNTWVYCPEEMGCFSPDVYPHKNQECWLKYAEKPRPNFKNKYPEAFRKAYPKAPLVVQWMAGVVSARD